MAGGVEVEVDIESLERAIPWLTGLRDYMRDRLRQDIADIDSNVIMAPDVAFGGFQSAITLATKYRSFLTSSIDSYQEISNQLDQAISATQEIIHNYRSAEERNRANANDVAKAFTDATSSSSTPSSTTSTGGYA